MARPHSHEGFLRLRDDHGDPYALHNRKPGKIRVRSTHDLRLVGYQSPDHTKDRSSIHLTKRAKRAGVALAAIAAASFIGGAYYAEQDKGPVQARPDRIETVKNASDFLGQQIIFGAGVRPHLTLTGEDRGTENENEIHPPSEQAGMPVLVGRNAAETAHDV